MQRTHHHVNRGGFALITAIFVIVIIATIMMIMLNVSAITSKRTTNNYLHEQAVLLAHSAVEYAMLAVSGHDRAGGCLNTITGNYPAVSPMFTYRVDLQYIGFADVAGCTDYIDQSAAVPPSPASGIFTEESIGNILLDVTVTTTPGVTTEPITYHRRTLQKL